MTTTPNPIDSLPATPETVGMPRIGDRVRCCECGTEWSIYFIPLSKIVFCEPCSGKYVCTRYDVEKVKP